MKVHKHPCGGPALSLLALALAQPAIGADWSITEAHLACGNLDIPTFAGGGGIISDIGLIWGYNWASDADVKKYLPGVRLVLDLGGFAFANLDITAYIDDSEGATAAGAPRERDSYMVDFNFARPFTIGKVNFSIEGHLEYIGGRDNEFGGTVEPWILAQPQFRGSPNEHLSLGLEYQYWLNKLRDGATDESTVQALLVWKF